MLKQGKLGQKAKEEYRRPDYTIRSMKELPTAIEKAKLKIITEEGYIKFKIDFKKSAPLPAFKVKILNEYRQKLYNIRLIGAYPNKVGYGNISIKENKGSRIDFEKIR